MQAANSKSLVRLVLQDVSLWTERRLARTVVLATTPLRPVLLFAPCARPLGFPMRQARPCVSHAQLAKRRRSVATLALSVRRASSWAQPAAFRARLATIPLPTPQWPARSGPCAVCGHIASPDKAPLCRGALAEHTCKLRGQWFVSAVRRPVTALEPQQLAVRFGTLPPYNSR